MANVILKTDFVDGEKLFAQQLNTNFSAIMAALATMNKITWQDDPDDSVITFRGTTEEVNQREIIDGQLLYDTTTGETYIDYGSQRISTGSGNAIYIGTGTPTNPSTQLWINPEESILPINTEVVNSMEGEETTKAPSVASAKSYIENSITTYENNRKMKKIWTNSASGQRFNAQSITLSSSDYDYLMIFYKLNVNDHTLMSTCAPKGYGFCLNGADEAHLSGSSDYYAACVTRHCTRTSDTQYNIPIANVNLGNSTTTGADGAAYLIPVFIYGCKF